MMLESELLALTADQIAAAVRQRMQLLAEKVRLTREEREDLHGELQQLRARYVYLRGGAAAAADLALQ